MSDAPIKFTAKMNGGSDVIRLLKRYPEKVGRTLESLVKQEARGLAVELARYTRPFGFTGKARLQGEKGVVKDIHKVFAIPSDAYQQIQPADPAAADRFWADVTAGKFARANKTLHNSSASWNTLSIGRLNPRLHAESRNAKGRVTRRTPAMIVTTPKALDTYIAKIQKRVGFAKGSWINAAKAIGGRVRNAAQWVSRHKQSPGTATVRGGKNPSVTLINNLDYIEQVCPESMVERSLRFAESRLRKALATSLRVLSEKFNREVQRRPAS